MSATEPTRNRIQRAPMNSLPTELLSEIAGLMRRHPAFASYLKTSRDAILFAASKSGPIGLILTAIRSGAHTQEDLRDVTGLSRSNLSQHLRRMIRGNLIEERIEPTRGNFRPRKLFFPKKK
jgi:DNA-binding MarR family transcriptional regulator